MRLVTRRWVIAFVVCALIVAWAVALAPWALWHESTLAEVRLALHSPADRPQSTRSALFELPDAGARVSISIVPLQGASALPAGFMASARWSVMPQGSAASGRAGWAGSADFSNGDMAAAHDTLSQNDVPHGPLRLRVIGVASDPSAVVVRLTRPRPPVAAAPLGLLTAALCVVLFGIPATTAKARRGKPVIFPPTHEHY